MIPLTSGPAMKGSAAQVADQMEDWYMSGACDGLMIGTPVSPKGLEDFVDLVVPELQRRSLFRTEYAGRSEEHTSELQSLMRISYAVFCMKKKTYMQLSMSRSDQ